MNLLSDIARRPLPEQASSIVAFFPVLPISIVCANILQPGSLTFWISLSVAFSTLSAIFGYYVPEAIRLRTTIVLFLLWFFLFFGFTAAGLNFANKTNYGLSILLAIVMLFFLIIPFLFWNIFDELDSVEDNEYNYKAKELYIKSLLFLTLILCLVSIVTIPMILFLSSMTAEKVLTTVSGLHAGIFLVWFFATAIIAMYQTKE